MNVSLPFGLPQPDPTRLPLGIVTGTGPLKAWTGEVAYSAYTRNSLNCVFTIPGRGLGKLDVSYHVLELQLLVWIATLPPGTKVVLMGHSQGAIHVLRFALEHPDLVAEVACLCGPLDGTWLADLVLPPMKSFFDSVAPGISDMGRRSEYLAQLRSRVETTWPHEVRVRLIAVSGDFFVRPRRSSLDLQFPASADVRRYYLGLFKPRGTKVRGKDKIDFKKDVIFVRAPGADHITVLFHRATRDIVGHTQQERHLHLVKKAA